MKLLSVNIGASQPLALGDREIKTGIFKQAVLGQVKAGKLGLESDVVSNTKHHGGADQAVYVYGTGDYAWWNEQLQTNLEPGIFGENLTVTDLESANLQIGDRLQIGTVLLEICASRIPCATLAARMGDAGFVKKFRNARRPGLYCRVLTEGHLQAGDTVTLEKTEQDFLTVLETFEMYYDPNPSLTDIQKILAAPVAIRARKMYEPLLEKAQTTS